MQIDFSTLIRDKNNDLPTEVETDDDGNVIKDNDGNIVYKEVEVEIGDHVLDFLQHAVQQSGTLQEISALKGIMSDISRGKTEYSDSDVKLIKRKIDEQLPLNDARRKRPIVLTSIAELLDIEECSEC